MAKTKPTETTQDDAPEEQENAADPEQDELRIEPGFGPGEDHVAALKAQVFALEDRLARVEQMAHTDHSITPEAVDHLTQHVMSHVHEHLRKTTGHSGLPVRGDQD